MADHSKPSVTSSYANYTAEIDARFDDLAVGLDPAVTTATNLPTNSQRWSSAAGKWQKWNGSSWGDLTSTYNISISGSAGSVEWANVANKPSSLVQSDGNTYNLSITGSAQSLTNARTINGVSFNGTANINVNTVTTCTFNNSGAGNASGITFDGGSARTISYNTIGAPSVAGANATGTWGISISGSSATCAGNASTASTLQTARTINGVSFNGSADINVEPYVETDSANANRFVTFVDSSTAGNQRLNLGTNLTYNPSTNTLGANVTGSASKLASTTGSAPSYSCRAWVNFDGTGTVAIRGSGNVSSITDNGIGDYTINFATPMPDRNYACVGMSGQGYTTQLSSIASGTNVSYEGSSPTTNSIRVLCIIANLSTGTGSRKDDFAEINILVIR